MPCILYIFASKALSNVFSLGFLILLTLAPGADSLSWHQNISVSSAATNIYYVSVTGSDSNPGTQHQPWRTIQKAANTMASGDICVVISGQYAERVEVTTSGTPGAPITFLAQNTVTMKGFSVYADYVTIKGFEITNTDNDWTEGWGIYLKGSNCRIEDNYIHYCTHGGILIDHDEDNPSQARYCSIINNRLYRNSQAAIEVRGRDHLIENNEIWGTIQYHPKWIDPPDWVDADGIKFFGSGHVFRRNYIHDITFNDPLNNDPHIDCFQTFGPAYGILFEHNYCRNLEFQRDSEYGKAFMISEVNAPVRDLTIRNNIAESFNHLTVDECENLKVVNNTFISDLSFIHWEQVGIALNNSPRAIIKNNIFYDVVNRHLFAEGTSEQGLDTGYNAIYRSDGKTPEGYPWPHDLWGVNPLFVSTTNKDFHLQPNSPCIDSGYNMPSIVPDDFEENLRPQRTGYDIGAYEYVPFKTEFVLDDTDTGFSASFAQDPWQEYVEEGGQSYGNRYLYNHQIGTGEDTATWTFDVPKAGEYTIYARWHEGIDKPGDVPYTVNHRDGSTTVRVDQTSNGGQWNPLGNFGFQTQGSVNVSDDVSSGQDIVADAIKLEYLWPYKIHFPIIANQYVAMTTWYAARATGD